MPSISLRFYSELNDFLAEDMRGVSFEFDFAPGSTIREIVETLRVPHEQIDLLLVNGQSVDLSYRPTDGDRIAVYPVFESFDISPLQTVHEKPLRQPHFILDVHLGKLAHHLRMLGFDTLYRSDYRDSDLILISTSESRILLSRDKKLLDDPILIRAYCVQETDPRSQLIEVLGRFDLFDSSLPFTHCLICNSKLRSVTKETVAHRLPERVRGLFNEFRFCALCDKVYWKGSHYEKMEEFIREILAEGKCR